MTIGARLAGQMPFGDNSPTAQKPKTNSVFQLWPVTEGQVFKLLHKLINRKAAGLNNISNADIIGHSLTFFLMDNISVQFGGCLFHQAIGIPMGTNCAPLFADLFLYSYENYF